MNDQDKIANAETSSPSAAQQLGTARQHDTASQGERAPYQRQTHHITQAPINDVEPTYVMPERYTTVEQSQQVRSNRPRKHMGVATSDPEYLPQTGTSGRIPPSSPTLRVRANERGGQPAGRDVRGTSYGANRGNGARPSGSGQLHYDRYLQTPKKGHSIFTSQQDRQRRRARTLLIVLVIAAVALALLWFFVLR